MHIPRSASLIILSLALLSLPIRAEWMEASGEATIINGNTAQAREEAINQAVSYATLSTAFKYPVNNKPLTETLHRIISR